MTMITPDFSGQSHEVHDAITELLRVHARHLIATALEVEVTEMVNELKSAGRDVVRNGYLPERSVTTVVGDIEVEVPRIRARDGEPINFASKLIPPYLRRSKSIDAWVAYAYLKGISEGDMAQVLEVVLGEGAKKLTPNVVSSLKVEWKTKFDEWKKRDLSRDTFSYIYADGIYQEIRGDNPKLCVLVVIGVDDQGRKHLLTLENGTRESTQSWREVLIDLKSRGMNEPLLAIGDGALGF
nr:transposase [Ferrimicrobium acidiphilum]